MERRLGKRHGSRSAPRRISTRDHHLSSHCKVSGQPASIRIAKIYLCTLDSVLGDWPREALRWFFREGRRANEGGLLPIAVTTTPTLAPGMPPVPSTANQPKRSIRNEALPAAMDLGGADWERDDVVAGGLDRAKFDYGRQSLNRSSALIFQRTVMQANACVLRLVGEAPRFWLCRDFISGVSHRYL
jgi:hypothetical protein